MPEAELNIMGEPIGLTVISTSDNGPSTQFSLGWAALGQSSQSVLFQSLAWCSLYGLPILQWACHCHHRSWFVKHG